MYTFCFHTSVLYNWIAYFSEHFQPDEPNPTSHCLFDYAQSVVNRDSQISLSRRCASCNNLDSPLLLSDFPWRKSHAEESYWVKGELFVIVVLKRCLLDRGNSVSWADMKSDGSQVIKSTDWCSLNERNGAGSTPLSVISFGNSFLCWCLPKMDDWFLWGSSVSSLHCPLPVHPIITVVMTYLLSFRGWHSSSLCLSLSLIGS